MSFFNYALALWHQLWWKQRRNWLFFCNSSYQQAKITHSFNRNEALLSALRARCCQSYVTTYRLLKMAVCFVLHRGAVYFVKNAQQRIRYCSLSTNEIAVSAVHPKHDEIYVTVVSCACVLLTVTPPVKRSPNETAPRMPFKCHAGAQETMLCYRCYFEWCHGVKVVGLNYCRALWCCLYLCCLVNTYNHTADSWSTAWYCHYNNVGQTEHRVMMIQHKGTLKLLRQFYS